MNDPVLSLYEVRGTVQYTHTSVLHRGARQPVSPSHLRGLFSGPWEGFLFGVVIVGLGYLCPSRCAAAVGLRIHTASRYFLSHTARATSPPGKPTPVFEIGPLVLASSHPPCPPSTR
jgi:hypothetical protein